MMRRARLISTEGREFNTRSRILVRRLFIDPQDNNNGLRWRGNIGQVALQVKGKAVRNICGSQARL